MTRIQRGEDGLWHVGIHIADVSHYVEEGGQIDQEAFKRATSVYLVDRVIPMLPEALSNDLCSLRPHEDRFAMSLLLRMDDDANVRDYELVRSVIRSAHKLSYEDAQEVGLGLRQRGGGSGDSRPGGTGSEAAGEAGGARQHRFRPARGAGGAEHRG